MARTYAWFPNGFLQSSNTNFHRVDLYDAVTADTIERVQGELWCETIQVIPYTGFPLNSPRVSLQVADGPFATWDSAHPSTPAIGSYGLFRFARLNWAAEIHSIESTKFVRWTAPLNMFEFDNHTRRKIKHDGDFLCLEAWLDTSAGSPLNPFGFTIQGHVNILTSVAAV